MCEVQGLFDPARLIIQFWREFDLEILLFYLTALSTRNTSLKALKIQIGIPSDHCCSIPCITSPSVQWDAGSSRVNLINVTMLVTYNLKKLYKA